MSCQKEQSSVELDGGSAFMQAFCSSLQGGAEMSGIAGPTQPIPIDALVVKINQKLETLLTPEKRKQVARLTGTTGNALGFEAKEPLAATISLKEPTVAGGNVAKPGAGQLNILQEISIIPQVRETRAGDINLLRAQNLPAFSADKLDGYKADGYQNLTDLEKKFKGNSDAFGKDFPLRAAYFEALMALQDSQKVKMRESLTSPVDPKRKAAFLLEQERRWVCLDLQAEGGPCRHQGSQRKAARWRRRGAGRRTSITCKPACAIAADLSLFEYNYTLGQIRADNLPELAPGQSGWRIGVSGLQAQCHRERCEGPGKEDEEAVGRN